MTTPGSGASMAVPEQLHPRRTASAQALTWQTLGAAFVLLGGAVAAVTGPLSLTKGSWAAAYLVLVCGVPQYLMGRLTHRGPATPTGWWMLAGWNLGNAAVVCGTLLRAPYLVDAGGVLLWGCLVAVLVGLLRRPPREIVHALTSLQRWLLIAAVVVLLISVPVGLLLAHLRAG
ncbi:hypothetical protein [Galactobacter sp.]|uniref:hypothetical protein n=1 Tax=Galactobacter sp. TaxID=2676125 RepID=UPI0025B9D229|nr:hypothetical protein [Galactobacter sp.]